MKVALVYPPSCDPTAPYVAVPLLAAVLRGAGVDVTTIDANVEAYDRLLRGPAMARLAERVRARFARLDRKDRLSHREQLDCLALWDALAPAGWVPAAIDDAVAVMRDRTGKRFYDPPRYDRAVRAIEGAMTLLGAAHAPLELDFASYRTPFSLLTADEIAADAAPARDPFHADFARIAKRLAAQGTGLVGVSVAFPGQVQPAFSLAFALRRAMPDAHLTVGGPAITQLLARLSGDALRRALGPFDTAVLFEGEDALPDLVRAVEGGLRPEGVIRGTTSRALADLPPPDFSTMPLDKYLSPEPVLPYDASRGCWWGRCAFCHYGLAEAGTACYRERPAERIVADVARLRDLHGARIVYFSNDSIAPRLALDVARRIAKAGLDVRWASDLRAEKALTAARCGDLAAGGAVAFSIGVESGSPRVLALIDKGVGAADTARAVERLADAGIAVEAMAFTGFPTETTAEALQTVRFLDQHRPSLALFICGEFALTPGSRVARDPGRFGVDEVWRVDGDEVAGALFYRERPGVPRDADAIDDAVDRLSRRWWLRSYPWAGSLSTAHTLLWYDRFGPGVFRKLATSRAAPSPRVRLPVPRHDLDAIATRAGEVEGRIWHRMVNVQRRVSRNDYVALSRIQREPPP